MGWTTRSTIHQLVVLMSISLVLSSSQKSAASTTHETLFQCLLHQYPGSSSTISKVLFTPNTTGYESYWRIRNPRLLHSPAYKPLLILAPTHESHIQASVICCRKHGIQLTVQSGGHDYEGLSYLSNEPFMMVNLLNFRSVNVNIVENTAWVQAGATLGEVYHSVAEKSRVHGFPSGLCHTIGLGGHLSGGGTGTMMRKYGLGADNVVDARMVDVNGRVLNRESMGEDLFWAIRGGGAASFGVVLEWKIRLVLVPPTVTVFNINKTLEEGATEVVKSWQEIAPKLDKRLFVFVTLQGVNVQQGSAARKRTVLALFQALFLGRVKELLPLTKKSFPELGLERQHCTEMAWINTTVFFAGLPPGSSPDVLLNRTSPYDNVAYKGKYDYVQQPIPEEGLKGLWDLLLEPTASGIVNLNPLGGKMAKITESEIPFPHRKGNLYDILYMANWQNEGDAEKQMDWLKRLHAYMTPYVSKSPRGAYLNAKDLDLGKNIEGKASYSEARVWGEKYFKNNFKRLALVKGMVDKDNFFRNEQSIIPLVT
ncbi:hypothetical protein H6P81_019111 [Aristolochia fimbriata]|uniref:FAD-binding PCMH-type domain-containing protein n=1 Tax=Aristolochia fimbriata TaxID=158543 RepID=A0AAV7DTG5_ARIFI|nr:hypothetical protein H6P81_019111 [Aristolochia fimbriata]